MVESSGPSSTESNGHMLITCTGTLLAVLVPLPSSPLPLFPHVQARLDVRDYLGGKPYTQLSFSDVQQASGLMRILEGSAGIGITF